MDNTIGRDMDKISGNTGFSFMKVSFIRGYLRYSFSCHKTD